tara:strand:+ start:1351 stop:1512 length:162 start_codon:yes stop_codon:yes gene_type:complete
MIREKDNFVITYIKEIKFHFGFHYKTPAGLFLQINGRIPAPPGSCFFKKRLDL